MIRKSYTFSFILRFCVVAVSAFVVLSVVLYVIMNKRLDAGYFEGIVTLSQLNARLPLIFLVTGVLQAAIVSGVLLVIALFWGHAVAGPVVRFRRNIQMVREGKMVDITSFRKEDQLHVLASAFETFQNRLSSRYEQARKSLVKADHLIEEYEFWLRQDVDNRKECAIRLEELYKVYDDLDVFLQENKKL